MSNIEHIDKFDTLNDGREKINKHAIDPANRAESNSIDAKNIANQSNQTSNEAKDIAINTDDRLDNMLAEELQDGEVVDARKPFGEEAFPNLGKRLDEQIGLNSDFREFEVEESFMRRTKNEFLERYANIRWFGADVTGQSNINNAKSAAESLSDTIFFPKGVYKINKFQSVAGKKYVGEKGTKIKIDYVEGESAVTWGLSTGCEYEKIHFYSSIDNLEWNRGDLANKTDIRIIDCRIEGFRHDSTLPNAWGLYLENSKRIRIKSTHFSDNTQADIAIVDGCEDIVLDSLTSDGNLHINFEPNFSVKKIKNVTIKNTKIAKLSLLNNSLTYDGTEKILIENCEIDLVIYRGLDVEFVNCKINKMIGGKGGKIGFAASLKLNGAISLSDNLIVDQTLDSYSLADPLSDWLVVYSTKPIRDVTARSLNLLKIGGTSTAEQVMLKPKVIQENGDKSQYELPVTGNESYLFTVVGKANYPVDASWVSLFGRIVFLDANDIEMTTSNVEVSMFRSVAGTNTNIKEQSIVITIPLNAKKMGVRVGVGFGGAATTSNVWIGHVALQKILSGNGSFNQNYQLKSTREKNILYLPEAPSAAKGWGHYQKNDLCYNSDPQSGKPVGWLCTETGYPGVWKSMGNLA